MKQTTKHKIEILIELTEILAPIALYVLFEAIHKDKYSFILTSPEWGIASLFLFFIGIKNYIIEIRTIERKEKKGVNETTIQMWVFLRFGLIISSILVTLFSVLNDNNTLLILRSILFILSIIFFILLTFSIKKQSH